MYKRQSIFIVIIVFSINKFSKRKINKRKIEKKIYKSTINFERGTSDKYIKRIKGTLQEFLD